MYRTIVKRAGVNPLTGKKQYKVYDSFDAKAYIVIPPLVVVRVPGPWDFETPRLMFMFTEKLHPKGSFINPRKALGL